MRTRLQQISRRSCLARTLGVEFLEDRRMLAVITVDSLDGNSNIVADGFVSLHEAILAANTNTSVDGSVAGNGPDTIVFAPELSGGRILFGTEFAVTQTLTIDASALDGGIELFGNGFTRLVNYTASTGSLTLRNLELSNGHTTGVNAIGGDNTFSGAAIRFVSAGTLTLDGSTVQDSRTDGARAKGGGIFTEAGNVTLVNSAVVNNSTGAVGAGGGGISTNSGALTLVNSTVAGNLTEGANAPGGGIYTRSGVITLENSTVALNETVGTNSDGGGLFVSNTTANPALMIRNSIVADNTVGTGSLLPDLFPDPNVVPTIDFSLIENIQGTGINPAAGIGNLFNIDPQLGLVANHGGPPTVELLPGSPARDAGDPNFNAAATPNDQRAAPFTREFNGQIDIGAFEAQAVSVVVDSTSEANNADFSSGDMSLREAIEILNKSPNFDANTPDTVLFDSLLSGATILLSDELVITEGVSIDASTLAQNIIIDAQLGSRVFNFAASDETTTTGDLSLAGLTLVNGRTTQFDLPVIIPAGGGAIRFASGGTLTLTDSVLSNSQADGPSFDGGAIVTESGSVTLVRSTISGSEVTGGANRGGGIYTTSGTVMLIDSLIVDNSTAGSGGRGGGGIYTVSGDVLLTNSTLSNNRTTLEGDGGGIATNSGTVTLTDSTVADNDTSGIRANGGGIATNTSDITLVRSTLSGNSTAGESATGGGIYSTSGDVMLTDSAVKGNFTTGYLASGGGLHVFIGTTTIVRSTLSDNYTEGDFAHGGGIHSSNDLLVFDSTVSGNRTEGTNADGGGIRVGDTLNISGSTITNNRTDGIGADGGGVLSSSAANSFFSIQNSIVAGNSVAVGVAPDLRPDPSGSNLDIDFSLIGDTSGSIVTTTTGVGNLLNVDPMLGPLSSLGGLTETHALLTGSPAIDAGNSLRTTDQRGLSVPDDLPGVTNAIGGNGSDIGAYEKQSSLTADFDQDDDVDGADFLAWQQGFGTSNAARTDGDSDGDNDVDAVDLAAWEANFGSATPALAAIVDSEAYLSGRQRRTVSNAELIDAAIALMTYSDRPDEVTNLASDEQPLQKVFLQPTSTSPGSSVSSIVDSQLRRQVISSEKPANEKPWVSDEILRSVFG